MIWHVLDYDCAQLIGLFTFRKKKYFSYIRCYTGYFIDAKRAIPCHIFFRRLPLLKEHIIMLKINNAFIFYFWVLRRSGRAGSTNLH
jgi:hypothetical protein